MKKRRLAVPIVDTATLTREEWLEYRKHGVGASDVPVILGLSPFKTVIKLFEEKTSRIPITEIEKQVADRIQKVQDNNKDILEIDFADCGDPIIDPNENFNLTTEIGHALEPVAAKYLSCKLGMPVFKDTKMYQHSVYPFLFVNLDYIMLMPDDNGELKRLVIIECKTATFWKKDDWENGVPENYVIQCRTAMAVFDVDEVLIICLLDNNEGGVFTYKIYRDFGIEVNLILSVKQFWEGNVEKGILPLPPLPSKIASSEMAYHASQYPKIELKEELFAEGLHELVDNFAVQYRISKQKEDEYLEEKEKTDSLKLQLSTFMLKHDKAKTGPLSLSWVRKSKSSMDFDAFKLAFPDLYAKYVSEQESMYFNVSVSKKKLEAMGIAKVVELEAA